MTTHIVIPVEQESDQLDKTVSLVEQNTSDYVLHIYNEPELNSCSCRQKAMDDLSGEVICFLDYDSEMDTPGWLPRMESILKENDDAGAVFGAEIWGSEGLDFYKNSVSPLGQVDMGPAACMMIDTRRVGGVKWDDYIGLRNGWLGGDSDEYDFCIKIKSLGYNLYYSPESRFTHTGGRGTMEQFSHTDRSKTASITRFLIAEKHINCPEDDDFFRGIKYVKAHDNNDCMIAPDSSLASCYYEVFRKNGLMSHPFAKKFGII
jgi:glycosyltransferase involved in cell wall biosynthesis